MSSETHTMYVSASRPGIPQMHLHQLLKEIQHISEQIGAGCCSTTEHNWRRMLVGEIVKRHYASGDIITALCARAEALRMNLIRCQERLADATDEIEELRGSVAKYPTQEIQPVQ